MALDGHKIITIDKISSVAYLRSVFAAWRAGNIVMPVEQGQDCPDIGWPIAQHISVESGGGWFDEQLDPDNSEQPAQISFTSGTTGTPKAVLLSRRALSDVTTRLTEVMEMDETIREYIAVPVTFSFGLGRARAIAAVGGYAYLPETGFRPDEFAAMLAAGEVNALSAVPTMLRLLIQQQELFVESGDKLHWLEIGSQYMSGEEKAAVRMLFPNAKIVQHYGLTEASRTTFLKIDGAPDKTLESVGSPTGSVHVEINEEERIRIGGAHVADGLLVDGKLIPLTDDDGFLTTNDLGRVENGLLHYDGRVDDVLNVSGIKVPAELFEQRLNEISDISVGKIGVAGRADKLRGWSVMIAYLPDIDPDSLQANARKISAEFGLSPADILLVQVPEIPKTGTGKIQRKTITERYSESAVYEGMRSTSLADDFEKMSPTEQKIANIWREALGVENVKRDDNFFDIGGDSLSAINLMLRAEQAGLSKDMMGHIFDGHSVGEIARLMDHSAEDAPDTETGVASNPKRGALAEISDALNSARGILVLLVIAAHWMPFFFDRMGAWKDTAYLWTHIPFRLGTPGFAMVFGMGLGLLYMTVLEKSPNRMQTKLRSNTIILAIGVGLNALVVGLKMALTDGFDPIWPERLLYTVLFFYLLMVPTSGILLRVVRSTSQMILGALAVAIAALVVSAFFQFYLAETQATGVLSLGRLMLIAQYSYPLMLSEVAIGLAIGLWLRTNQNRPDLVSKSAVYGAILLVGGAALVPLAGRDWFSEAGQPLSFPAFAGAVLLLFAVCKTASSANFAPIVIRLLVITGILAFPAFVGHGLVIHVKNILVALGLAELISMGIAVGMFFAAALFAYLKLYRIYYGHLSNAKTSPRFTQPV
ncbi:AMP-binding protein [Sphingorhabdus sp. Alg231-15]|uniref:AMP-binding protein n=1 Tax=Sphingorhabdus sp. Alg231-15 TaxID=1922222 RepID=UPI000D54D941